MRHATLMHLSRGRRGALYVATLMIFLIFMAMVGVALRVSAGRRNHLRVQTDAARALCLAESGAAEALQRLRAGDGATTCKGTMGHATYAAAWRPVAGRPGEVLITSTGLANTHRPGAIRKTVSVRVRVKSTPGTGPQRVRVVTWKVH